MSGLKRILTLTDLTLFGVASIMGSGGFNLIGNAVRAGGSQWPMTCGFASLLLLGTSYTYSRMFEHSEKGNTMESDVVRSVFGKVAEYTTIAGILVFNIVSISVILVFCSHILVPSGPWIQQVTIALSFLAGMTYVALEGIEYNRTLIDGWTIGMVIVLTAVASLGMYGSVSSKLPDITLPSFQNWKRSLLLFFFVLAGFDALTKFVEETKDTDTVPRSFFTSNLVSVVLTFGIALAIALWVPLTKGNEDNAFGHVLEHFLGNGVAEGFLPILVACMLVTTFVVFLSITRNIYGVGKTLDIPYFLRLNDAKAPYVAIGLVAAFVAFGILNNHTETLVMVSDFGLIATILLVSAAVSVSDWKKGNHVPASFSCMTTIGVGSLLALYLV